MRVLAQFGPFLVVLLVIVLVIASRSMRPIPLFLSVAAMAAGLFILSYVPGPLAGWFAARSWVETPCTIVSSTAETQQGRGGRVSSRLALRYAYEVAGRRLEGSRFDFGWEGFETGDEAARLAESLPPGTKTSCYVDPGRPDRSVLRREFSTDLLAFGIPGLVFAGAGAGIFLSTLREARSRS